MTTNINKKKRRRKRQGGRQKEDAEKKHSHWQCGKSSNWCVLFYLRFFILKKKEEITTRVL